MLKLPSTPYSSYVACEVSQASAKSCSRSISTRANSERLAKCLHVRSRCNKARDKVRRRKKQISDYSTGNINLDEEIEKLSKSKQKLEKQVELLEKELEECNQ